MSYFSEPIKFMGGLGEFQLDINCYEVHIPTEHLLTDGRWIKASQKRWVLAKNIDHCREIIDRELKNSYFWPEEYHKAGYPIVYLLHDPKQRNRFNHSWLDDSFNPQAPNE